MTTGDLTIRVLSSGWDDEEIDRRTRDLLAEIREAGAERVGPAGAAAAPAGTKSGHAFEVGALVVAVAPAVAATVLGVVASWLSRQRREVEIEIDGERLRAPVTKEQADRLVEAFLRRQEERSV